MEARRLREWGLAPGIFSPGKWNAITDVPGVSVGHFTWVEGEAIRTGATAVLPHPGNLFLEKTPAGLAVGNGYGKLAGATQIVELGEIETPVVLTNTLAVPQAVEAILEWTLGYPGNEAVRSVNAVVGETNDGVLNDIRGRALSAAHIRQAIETAVGDCLPAEGCVGAGTGTVAFGWKGGIGTSSRQLPDSLGGYTVGVLVQSNFGGVLQILGMPVGVALGQYAFREQMGPQSDGGAAGSIMIVAATDAPLSDRNLTRLARRALAGLARTGASFSNGSGDYALAFSVAPGVRRTPQRRRQLCQVDELPNERVSPLFQAIIEATEEAIYNSLFMATTTTGCGKTIAALPVGDVMTFFGGNSLNIS